MIPIYDLVNALSGVFYALLGVFVLAVRPRDATNRRFASFAVGFGLAMFLLNGVFMPWAMAAGQTGPLVEARGLGDLYLAITGAFFLVAAVSLGMLAAIYPSPVPRLARKEALVILVPAVWYLIVQTWYQTLAFVAPAGYRASAWPPALLDVIGFHGLHAVAWAVVTLFAFRYRRGPPEERRALSTMTLAIVLYVGYAAGSFLVDGLPGPIDPNLAGALAVTPVLIVAAGAWLRNTAVPDDGRRPRDLVIVMLAAALAALVTWTIYGSENWGYGLMRTLGVLVLSYAIVRHQLLGIDVKVRWGLSRTTVAAVFIAVFFVASEAAQVYFERRAGETDWAPYLGILAAGALVFAIAPLSRFADHLAEKAVPLTPLHGAPGAVPSAWAGGSGADREGSYRGIVRLALRDRVLTRQEERTLLDVAEKLGLPLTRATAIIDEVERDVAVRPDGPRVSDP